MRKRSVTLGVLLLIIGWNMCIYIIVSPKTSTNEQSNNLINVHQRLGELNSEIERHILDTENLLINLRQIQQDHAAYLTKNQTLDSLLSQMYENITIAVLIVGCNRPAAIERTITQILRYRYSETKFPIIVSLDCAHQPTIDVVRGFGKTVKIIEQPDNSMIDVPQKNRLIFYSYYAISRHYKWMLSQVFDVLQFDVAIIVEDDLDISPDFFEYFSATYSILHSDPSLWCVSAWNDNGKSDLIEDKPELLYRTDFFPGLGWMLEKKIWRELENKWPNAFWDDWMRYPEQRKGRACIRPEISRTSTFGRIGVSRGQYYDKHLKFIKLNEKYVPFRERDLSYLLQVKYDAEFLKRVYSTPMITMKELLSSSRPELTTVRLQYDDEFSFKFIAKQLKFMDDLKSGVPRAAYHGIVSLFFDYRRVFIAPPVSWKGYETS